MSLPRPDQAAILLSVTEQQYIAQLHEATQSFTNLLTTPEVNKVSIINLWQKNPVLRQWYRGKSVILDEQTKNKSNIGDQELLDHFVYSLGSGAYTIISAMWRGNERLTSLVLCLDAENFKLLLDRVIDSYHGHSAFIPAFISDFIQWANKPEILQIVYAERLAAYKSRPLAHKKTVLDCLNRRINQFATSYPNHPVNSSVIPHIDAPEKRKQPDTAVVQPPAKIARKEPASSPTLFLPIANTTSSGTPAPIAPLASELPPNASHAASKIPDLDPKFIFHNSDINFYDTSWPLTAFSSSASLNLLPELLQLPGNEDQPNDNLFDDFFTENNIDNEFDKPFRY